VGLVLSLFVFAFHSAKIVYETLPNSIAIVGNMSLISLDLTFLFTYKL
jgi:hypothetical protein